jgi:poly(beta-D-mannuronate) C5 epimerase
VRSKPGKISVRRMMQEDALKDFIGGDNKMAEWVVRQHGIPQAIFVDDGYMNLKDWRKAAQAVPQRNRAGRVPGQAADRGRSQGHPRNRRQTQELRLSQEAGSFLVNDGQLFVRDTKVTGWREKDNGPATFRSPKEFRPFLLAWGGTETYIVNSKMASFGYANSKSYGVSISQYTPNMAKVLKRPEPTGWIVGSEFSTCGTASTATRPATSWSRATPTKTTSSTASTRTTVPTA